MKKLIFITTLIFCITSCAQNEGYFCEDFETEPLINWNKEIIDSTRAIVSKKAGRLGKGIELIIYPEDGQGSKKNKYRSEIYYAKYTDSVNTEKYYSWSFFLPEDQKIDTKNIGKQVIIAQIHSRPKAGETWKDYIKENPFNRPSIALSLAEEKDGLYLYLKYGFNGKPDFEFSEYRWQTIAKKKVYRGKWNDVLFHVKYSQTNQGFISAFLNDEYFTPFNGVNNKVYGANMHNLTANYIKFGLYRYFKNATIQSIYIDQFRTSTNIDDVK